MGGKEKKMIMIVDDNVELLEELKDLLTDEGYSIRAHSRGAPAVADARETPPDLVLLDLKMDGKSGFSVAQELTHRPETANVPVLGMTGYYSGHMYATLMSIIGFKGCMSKPLDSEKLLGRISELLAEEEDGRAVPRGNESEGNYSEWEK
jgi:DNA-binding response OmpR family regulator